MTYYLTCYLTYYLTCYLTYHLTCYLTYYNLTYWCYLHSTSDLNMLNIKQWPLYVYASLYWANRLHEKKNYNVLYDEINAENKIFHQWLEVILLWTADRQLFTISNHRLYTIIYPSCIGCSFLMYRAVVVSVDIHSDEVVMKVCVIQNVIQNVFLLLLWSGDQ